MKLNKIFLISILLISMLSLFVSASSLDRFALKDYVDSDDADTYSLRSSHYNGISDYNDIQSCNVGFGTELGTYPVTLRIGDLRYNYLVVPTSSAIRIINSNCGEINVITIPDVTFVGTMSTIAQTSVSDYDKYVMLGYNSSDYFSFYSFTFNATTTQIQFEKSKGIGEGIDLNKFHGVACGWESEVSVYGACGVMDKYNLIYWDYSADTITNYTSSVSTERSTYTETPIPYGAVVDFDNDNQEEMIFGSLRPNVGNKLYINYVSFDMFSRSFDKEVSEILFDIDMYFYVPEDGIVDVTPCQLGGIISDMEMCFSGVYTPDTPNFIPFGGYIKQDLSKHIYYGTSISGGGGATNDVTHHNMLGYDYNGNGNKELVIIVYFNSTHDHVRVIDSSDSVLTEFYIDSVSPNNNGLRQSILMDVDGDDREDLIFNNGQIYDMYNINYPYTLDYLSNSSHGYLVNGDLNGDRVNEIIYSDASNIYIYSTNPTSDYETDLSTPIPYAFDNDGGINYTVSDYTYNGSTLLEVNYNQTVAYDTCLSSNLDAVREYFLVGTSISYIDYDCTTGGYFSCLAGMCLSESNYNETSEGILNGSIDFISGGVTNTTTSTSTTTTTNADSINFVLDSLNNNLKFIFGLFMIAGIVIITAQKSKNPMVLIFVGIIATILMLYLGMIPAVVLIIILIALVLLMLLAFAMGNRIN